MIAPEFKEFERGEKIVTEGSLGSDVFLISEGEAVVQVRGVEVGRIRDNEIFCVKSALTGTPRNATVICNSDRCFVLSISTEQFRGMVRERPEVGEKLIEDLVRVIGELNETVISLKGSSAPSSKTRAD